MLESLAFFGCSTFKHYPHESISLGVVLNTISDTYPLYKIELTSNNPVSFLCLGTQGFLLEILPFPYDYGIFQLIKRKSCATPIFPP